MRAFILRVGSDGPFFWDRARMALYCGVWAGAKRRRGGSGTEPESRGEIRLSAYGSALRYCMNLDVQSHLGKIDARVKRLDEFMSKLSE